MENGIHELTVGYALDALEPEERRAYEAHLPTCDRCQEELAGFWQTTEALAVAASGPEPDRELRERMLAAARAEPQVVLPFESRRRRAVPALAAVAAVAAVVALVVGVWAARLSSDLSRTRSALERQRAAAALLADPSSRSVPLSAGSGRLVVNADGQAVLVLDRLAPAPPGKTYEAWIIASGTPRSAGLFSGRNGVDVVGVDGTLGRGDVVAVTIEKAGGTSTPTSKPIVASSPV
jgi:anti-sigma-K factor RskA